MIRSAISRLAHAIRRPYPVIKRLMAEYRATQWDSDEGIAERQTQRLESLFEHAWAQVPFYRRRFEEVGAISAKDVMLGSLPVLTKLDIRSSMRDLTSRDAFARGARINRTGGSTGEPVTLLQDNEYRLHSEAMKYVRFEWTGYRLGDAMTRLWGAERDMLTGGGGVRGHIARLIHNRRTFNAFRMTPADMRRYLAELDRAPPVLLVAYSNAAYEIARFAVREGIGVRPPGAVLCSSGPLHPFMRTAIATTFGAPVFDQYGSREVSCIACECEHHDGMHFSSDTLIVEVLDDKGRPCAPGAEGNIIVTSLVNRAMPLIRYAIGDRGALARGKCSCGRQSARLAYVSGRSMDSLRRRDGTIIPGIYLVHFLGIVFNRGWIEKVQYIQEDYDRILVRVVRARDPTRAELSEVERTVRLAMGADCQVEVKFEVDIPPDPSGKFRYVRCMLPVEDE